jgi:hypothetical protein
MHSLYHASVFILMQRRRMTLVFEHTAKWMASPFCDAQLERQETTGQTQGFSSEVTRRS